MRSQLELIVDGWCHGPLFNQPKRRAPILRTSRQHGARRRAREKRATPPWADKGQIRRVYAECEQLNRCAGYVKYHVDHRVPLDGKIVCGLHVNYNLRIVEAGPNLKKGWMTWDDMPMEQLELI